MIVQDILAEVITLPEAVDVASELGYKLDRSNLLRYAQSGRLAARKSKGTWLTTRAAIQELIVELATREWGRPRPATPTWATFEMTPALEQVLDEIDTLREQIAASTPSTQEQDRRRRELTIEAIYHTNRIEGNTLSLAEVRAIVEAVWAEEVTSSRPGA